MQPLSLATEVHRAVAKELIDKAPAAIVDELLEALCARLIAMDAHETGHPSHVERVARILRAFQVTVHLPVIIYDALDGARVTALLTLALDRLAIDGTAAEVETAAVAAERFLDAVREPAVTSVMGARARE